MEASPIGERPLTPSGCGAYLPREERLRSKESGSPGVRAMVYRFGDCSLDTRQHRLQRAGQPMRLRSKVFQILCYLLEHRDRTVLKQELCEQVWPQQFISDATLESTVRAVRQAIGDTGRAQLLIRTVYGYGYRFIMSVEVGSDISPGAPGATIQSLPVSVSAPPPDDDINMPPVPRTPMSPGDDDDHHATGMRDDGGPTPQQTAPLLRTNTQSASEPAPTTPANQPMTPPSETDGATSTLADAVVLSPVWEQKSVAVLAIECTFPKTPQGKTATDGQGTAASRWEEALVAKVQGFGGVLLQRSPSLLLVVFGIPQTLEQLPQRAVQAALTLQTLVAEGSGGEPGPELRQAVHGGRLLVDVSASDPTARLLQLGEVLALPVRLLGHAVAGEILVSSEVGRLVEGWCERQPHAGPPGIETSLVTGLTPRSSPLRLHGRRQLSRFVGRERELATLTDLLTQATEGRGQVVGIVGEPGVGKSRMCYEFLRSSLAHPWPILETQGTAYGQAIPYLPIIDLLKGYFRLEGRDDPPTVRDKLTAKLRGLDDPLIPTAPAFLTLLDMPVEDREWQALDAPQRRQRTLDAIKRLVVWESQWHPLLLVVENLHWIDAETQAVLDTLIESLPAARLFLLTTYRPEYQHGWGNKSSYTQLRLDPLPRERASELLKALMGDDAGLQPLKQLLIERTEGNPFFLEENVRTLVEIQALVGKRGAYRLAQALPSVQVPATVQAVLAARIDRLAAEEKRLLQTAAVIGTQVPFPLLQAVAELPEGLRTGLAHLQDAEFLYETSLFPELAYTFKHALTQEVAYGSLLQERRRTLHARIVEALEALYADRLAEQVEHLAHHALRGEVWDKAVTYCRQAGARAYDRALFREAVAYFDQALQALEHLPEPGDTRGLAIELRLALARPLWALGEYGRPVALLGEAETLARASTIGAGLQVLARMATVLRITGDPDGAIAAGQQALALATELTDSALQVEASYNLGQAYFVIGDFGRAVELLQRSVEAEDRASGWPGTDLRIQFRAWLAHALSMLGAFAEGRRHGEEALRLATLQGRGATAIIVHNQIGLLYLAKGDLEHAIGVLDQGLALCRASGHRTDLRLITAGLGYAYALQGRLAEGRALLGEAISEDIRMGALATHSRRFARLSEVCRLAGCGDEAWQHARQALDLAQQHKERSSEAHALHQLGAVQAHASPPDVAQAEAYYQQALALAEELGMRPLQAHCHFGLGTLYMQIGRRKQARAELSTAIELYRAMDMVFWLPQAEAALTKAG